jgi:hypothetical protein
MNLSADKTEVARTIAEHCGIEEYFFHVQNFNVSNDLPYHNWYHTTCMFLNCYEGVVHTTLNKARENDFDDWTCSLLIAALFHDFGHSGGSQPDSVNIKVAISGLKEFSSKLIKSFAWERVDNVTYTKKMLYHEKIVAYAIEIIKATEYPYTFDLNNDRGYEYHNLRIHQRIIRDADLMQVYEKDQTKLYQQHYGLYKEFCVKQSMDFEDFIDGCKKFNLDIMWNSYWGKLKAAKEHHKDKLVPNLINVLRNSGVTPATDNQTSTINKKQLLCSSPRYFIKDAPEFRCTIDRNKNGDLIDTQANHSVYASQYEYRGTKIKFALKQLISDMGYGDVETSDESLSEYQNMIRSIVFCELHRALFAYGARTFSKSGKEVNSLKEFLLNDFDVADYIFVDDMTVSYSNSKNLFENHSLAYQSDISIVNCLHLAVMK